MFLVNAEKKNDAFFLFYVLFSNLIYPIQFFSILDFLILFEKKWPMFDVPPPTIFVGMEFFDTRFFLMCLQLVGGLSCVCVHVLHNPFSLFAPYLVFCVYVYFHICVYNRGS